LKKRSSVQGDFFCARGIHIRHVGRRESERGSVLKFQSSHLITD
jgi:hypothetical protein